MIIDLKKVKDIDELIKKAKWLEGKTLSQVDEAIKSSDRASRVKTKGGVGHVLEKGFFGIEKNNLCEPDISSLGVEIKTCPLKFDSTKTRLSVKEPLSMNLINYCEEHKVENIKQSSWFKKNHQILLICYIHDKSKERSQYLIKYVFLWELDDRILEDFKQDYFEILKMIKKGKAHEIHQKQHRNLTICPKHSGKFKNPECKRSKRLQPFSDVPAEIRAFRVKSSYMNKVISKHLKKTLGKKGWLVD